MSRRSFGTVLAVAVVIPLICTAATFARPFSSGSVAASAAATIEPAPAFTPAQQQPYAGADWLTIGGNLNNDRYSTLTQINRTNVGGLRRAWRTVLPPASLKSAGALGGRPSFQANALAYKGVLYISTGANQVFALDGQTGQILLALRRRVHEELQTADRGQPWPRARRRQGLHRATRQQRRCAQSAHWRGSLED